MRDSDWGGGDEDGGRGAVMLSVVQQEEEEEEMEMREERGRERLGNTSEEAIGVSAGERGRKAGGRKNKREMIRMT